MPRRYGFYLVGLAVSAVAVIAAIQLQPGGTLNSGTWLMPCQLLSDDAVVQAGGDTWRGVRRDPTVSGECRWQTTGVLLTVQRIDPDGQSFAALRHSYEQDVSVEGTQVTALISSGPDRVFYYGSPPSPREAKGIFAQGSRGDIVEIDVPAGRISESGLDSLAAMALERLGDS